MRYTLPRERRVDLGLPSDEGIEGGATLAHRATLRRMADIGEPLIGLAARQGDLDDAVVVFESNARTEAAFGNPAALAAIVTAWRGFGDR